MARTHDISPRGSLCIDCRTALLDGESCDGGKGHRVVSLAQPEGREKLVTEVWGPPSVRRRVRELAKVGGGGAGVGGVLEGCGSCGGCDAAGIGGEAIAVVLVIAAVALLAIVVYWIVKKIVEHYRAKQNAPKPHGAMKAARGLGHPRAAGRAVGEVEAFQSPGSGTPCLAYGVDLCAKAFLGSATMMRDAVTAGFEIELDGAGGRVRIPPGRVRLEGPARKRSLDDVGGASGRLLPPVAPSSKMATTEEQATVENPFPFDWVDERLVQPGDRVQLCSPMDPDPEESAAYRSAPTRFVARGVPALRVTRRAGQTWD